MTGDENDLIRLARKMLNRTTSDRVISKQECVVESTDIPLTLCSDMIQTISISGSSRIHAEKPVGKKSLMDAYMTRPVTDEGKSFSQFVHDENKHVEPKIFVPHYVGMNNSPTYPVSPTYARSTLIIHIPWRNGYYHRLNDSACVSEFHDFMKRCQFPTTVKLNYLQAKNRYEQSITAKENQNNADDGSEVDEDDQFLLTHLANLNATTANKSNHGIESDCFHRGLDYDWSQRHTVSN
jgi:hypothetical protein